MGTPKLDPQGEYHPKMACCRSDTANMLVMTELAEQLKNKDVYSFTSTAGGNRTRLGP